MRAFTSLEVAGGYKVVMVDSSETGYYELDALRTVFGEEHHAEAVAAELNKMVGVSREEAIAAVMASMFEHANYEDVLRGLRGYRTASNN